MGEAVPPAPFDVEADGNGLVEVHVEDPVVALHDLTHWAIDHRLGLEGLEVVRPSLEDVYMALTRESLGGEAR